ncbi:juvenile hormone esterase-like [Leptopilina heterotoma]|uniref:juvenile hormone esterase-like n=1 Tax=Leptopilina heterotoma TaxID=63436 RepID=UPI001CA97EBF|nr:juvenile hormone esterase-like [Leptopilina heterotoma]
MNIRSLLVMNLLWFLSVNTETLVKISQGQLEGNVETGRYGRRYSAFLGIPYAKPPIGDRRFRNPEPADGWTGIRSAHSLGSECPQNDGGKIFGNDDCLFLNVYTPLLNFEEPKPDQKLLPVMVFIHGGSFLIGSGNMYGAQYLLQKDIILVTFNYRLGILGFLTTADEVAPGNFGLKDQVLALKWIQKNIRSFGGDPRKVTLFGQSAGGASVNLHLISSASDGLFSKIIMQSGTALGPGGYQEQKDFKQHIEKLAKKFRCSTSSSQLIINCLRKVNSNDLVKSSSLTETMEYGHAIWIPTIESKREGAFLTEIPLSSVNNNRTKDLPLLSGNCADEGLSITDPNFSHIVLYLLFRFNFRTSMNYIAKYYNQDADKLFQAMNKFYFDNRFYLTLQPKEFLNRVSKFYSDGSFFYPQIRLLEKIQPRMKSNIYFYNFGYRGALSMAAIGGIKGNSGVTHGDDILYLFPITSTFTTTNSNFTGGDEKISRLMVDFWTSFATNGRPTSNEIPNANLWQPYSATSASHIQIGNIKNNKEPTVEMSSDYYTERINFWRKNVPI